MRGVDVSVFNEVVDWQALKAAGIDFAICRTGFGKSDADESFQKHVEGAHAAGLICGAYHFSYALTPSAAAQEAAFCKDIIEKAGVMLELPVWFYMEDSDGYKKRHGFELSGRHVTDICKAFIDNIKPLHCGVYSSYSWLTEFIDWQSLGCEVWSAQWGAEDSFKGRMWQYTNELAIGGQTFNGNILYDTAVQGASAPVETPQPAQSANDQIHSILSGLKPQDTATPTATPPATSTAATVSANDRIQQILAGRKNAQPEAAAELSTQDKIKQVLANARKNK